MRKEWGHHEYAGRAWFRPFDAFEHARLIGDRSPQLAFKMPAADRIDWQAEPEERLAELYRRRAQELRDRYDYLILMYSGGSDSHQMLMAFLNAGIFLDEVRTVWPMQWVDRMEGNPSQDHPLATLYEYRLAAVPGLKLLSLRSPHTKIVVCDTTDAYSGDMDAWQAMPLGARVSGGLHGLTHAVKSARWGRDLTRVADARGGKVGVLFGADKPNVKLVGRELYVFFRDNMRVGIDHWWQQGDQVLYEPVMFYWGAPVLTCKQAHAIKRMLGRNPQLISNEDALRRAIYPDFTGAYQQREPDVSAILATFIGARAGGIAAERTRYYNGLKVIGSHVSDVMPETGIRGRRHLVAQQTKLYFVGTLACDFSSSAPWRSSSPRQRTLERCA